jgi:bacterioferritin (cytochrome b1)
MFPTHFHLLPSHFNSYPRETDTISNSLYEELSRKTQEHINYLSTIGLGERAKGISLRLFQDEENKCREVDKIDLTPFNQRTAIPLEASHFDAHAKNTLITIDPDVSYNKQKDLTKILDIRLYPALRDLIKENNIEVFLGTKQEMVAYYLSKKNRILFEFNIPSSATYYLAASDQQELCVIMAGLVGRENLIAQLITLKLAGLNIDKIEIIGEIDHFTHLVDQDINQLLQKQPWLKNGRHTLIVAGCGLEENVNHIVSTAFKGNLGEAQSFKGNIISLTSHPNLKPLNGIHGCVSLHLNYGEITQKIVSKILELCKSKFVFTGGAGGYISNDTQTSKPEIGTRISITKSMNENGEVANLIDEDSQLSNTREPASTHLQIASIFLETYKWLEKARNKGSSVDVETFYIIRAIQDYNKKNPSAKIQADCGYFVSDYVGEQPLREYSKVYEKYQEILSVFLTKTMTST